MSLGKFQVMSEKISLNDPNRPRMLLILVISPFHFMTEPSIPIEAVWDCVLMKLRTTL